MVVISPAKVGNFDRITAIFTTFAVEKEKEMLRILKDWMLPIAMLAGILFRQACDYLSGLIPYLIFTLMLLAVGNLSPRDIRLRPLHGWLLLIQFSGCALVYFAFVFFNPVAAEAALVCVFAPTATSAVVMTGLLGGNIAFLTTYVLIVNLGVALLSPFLFSFLGVHGNGGPAFFESVFHIFWQLFRLLILPMLCAWVMRKFTPGLHRHLQSLHQLSFYLWAIALAIVIGKTVVFLTNQDDPNYGNEIFIAFVSLVICVLQFWGGRKLGKRYGEAISVGQGLGQKNTVLAIWMAQTHLNPIASIGPAAYVVWQNSIHSYLLWQNRKRGK